MSIVSCMYCGRRKSEFSATFVTMADGFRCKSVTMCQRRVRAGTPRVRGIDMRKAR